MAKPFQIPFARLKKLQGLRGFLRGSKISVTSLLLPVFLAFLASIFEGASLALLIPTIDAVIHGTTSGLQSNSTMQKLFEYVPASIQQSDSLMVKFLFASVILAAVAKIVLLYFSDLASTKQVVRLGNTLRTDIFARYLSFGKMYFEENNLGRLYQTLTTYTDSIATILRNSQNAAYSAFTLTAYLVVMFTISARLTLIVLLLFPTLHYCLAWLIARIKVSSRKFTDSYNVLGKKITNSLSTMALVKSYSLEERELEWFSHVSTQVENLQFSIAKKQLLVSPIQEIILLMFLLFLVVLIVIIEPQSGAKAVPSYAVFMLMLRRGSVNFSSLNNLRSRFAEISGPMAEIMKVFDDHDKHFVHNGSTVFESLNDEISIRGLSFGFARGAKALRNITVSFRKNQVTALVGQTGSGKSTIANLLMRFYDCPAGTIFVDGIDIRDLTVRSWRSKIAIVSQEALLFHGTFRDNLVYGLENVTEEEVVSALEKSRLFDLIMSLPDGLETEIGDHGVKLSGGERQRVSIARAFLKNADILIMDEPTSALDSRTESLIQEDLDRLSNGKTVIMIAHRLATIKNADHVIVLESGQVIEEGSTKDLLAKRGAFFEYWGAQQIA